MLELKAPILEEAATDTGQLHSQPRFPAKASGRLRLGRAHGPAAPVCQSKPWVGFKVVGWAPWDGTAKGEQLCRPRGPQKQYPCGQRPRPLLAPARPALPPRLAPRTPAVARMLHSCTSVAETMDGLVESRVNPLGRLASIKLAGELTAHRQRTVIKINKFTGFEQLQKAVPDLQHSYSILRLLHSWAN